ncbi:uncharacterized protein BO95DRAFT_434269 [Aspergillus brunneoviolaceus CBS 621.78]|uniref:Uncharacterized protein n=1 Tax=Aspergillus brunneoviolaceus CBS 621.78 TaxID=1450534 RepID=A0ACD1G257_9EURO|nr:hypothetical protein BO95DRAFT_434269 [Aspergillus brunneoviolaceus CBS 621.78]RAH43231.1 hypothetical protein BO95DRAFT_434269 [Aspergillus brunneoviolaceus CBS 621.78]
MAGTGKSTISRANLLNVHGSTVASFFFRRGEQDRGNARLLFTTISKQLAVGNPELISDIRAAVSSDPDIAVKSLKEQWEKLLLGPLMNLVQTTPRSSVVLITDALDECEIDNDIRDILRILPQAKKLPMSLRILLTSRPELPVRLGFARLAHDEYRDLALYNVPEDTTAHDIALFIKDRFTRIKEVRDVPYDWPTDEEFEQLLSVSVPLFISAATMCRFIESKLDPVESLTSLLEDQVRLRYATKMDQTYLPILRRLLHSQDDDDGADQLLENFRQIIGVMIFLAIPLSVNTLSKNLLGFQVELSLIY